MVLGTFLYVGYYSSLTQRVDVSGIQPVVKRSPLVDGISATLEEGQVSKAEDIDTLAKVGNQTGLERNNYWWSKG
jgi:hypothetical protein